jgi:hypothetical protein
VVHCGKGGMDEFDDEWRIDAQDGSFIVMW